MTEFQNLLPTPPPENMAWIFVSTSLYAHTPKKQTNKQK